MTPQEREKLMVESYGEVCNLTTAGRILSRSRDTVRDMLDDGRLRAACEGTRVDVRSIARYICAPAKIDSETRLRKRRERDGVSNRWSV